MKTCSNCKIEKNKNEFNKHIRNKDGLDYWCRECKNIWIREYYNTPKGKESITKSNMKWNVNNKEKVKHYGKIHQRKRRKDNRKRMDNNMATVICLSLKGVKAGRKWQGLVGYTTDELISHLETFFHDGMTWENYGEYWHVDHVIPKSLFQYETAESVEFKNCWSLNNLRPMKKSDNLKKNKNMFYIFENYTSKKHK